MASLSPFRQNYSVDSGLPNDTDCNASSERKKTPQLTDENSNVSVNIKESTKRPDKHPASTRSGLCRSSKTEELPQMASAAENVIKRTQSLTSCYKPQEPVQEVRPRAYRAHGQKSLKYSRSQSDNDILSAMDGFPTLQPVGSISDHVTLPPLTKSAHRRHTFPSLLLPTITVWEADDGGPDADTNPNDFSKANLNLLLPIEHSTIVSSTLLQQRRRSLPGLRSSRTKLSALLEEEDEDNQAACAEQYSHPTGLRRRARSLDNELRSTTNAFWMRYSPHLNNSRL